MSTSFPTHTTGSVLTAAHINNIQTAVNSAENDIGVLESSVSSLESSVSDLEASVTALENVHHSDNEIPAETPDGTETDFTLDHAPSPAASLMLFLDGVFQMSTEDFTLSGPVVTFLVAPVSGSKIRAFYRY